MPFPSTKPELLAPAGTLESGLAAFDAGADAVYAGLPRFNARERGENCSQEELSKLIAYAHTNGRHVYVTLNTLVKDHELPEICDMLCELAMVRPDALIVQDLGIVRLAREYFPELRLHASTQMGIHNSAGADIAVELGITRVILERQVTFQEIRQIREKSKVELEVFIHGALCCSRAGACLLSSWMGGWSGNRGRCKQPCRRRYFSPEGNGFFFSTKDLYSLDAIPELRRLGISSLKIEGRLRRADYVRAVVSAYRLVLDAPEADAAEALKEGKRILSQGLGRKWTPAFRTNAEFAEVIQHDALGASGLLCGKVTRHERGAVEVNLRRSLRVGDTIRIQPDSGDEGPAVTIAHLTVSGRSRNSARAGETCRIACDAAVTAHALVYKTGQTTDTAPSRVAALPSARPFLDLQINVSASSITVRIVATDQQWESQLSTDQARKHALSDTDIIGEFRRSRSSLWSAGNISTRVEPGRFLPASDLKQLRRDFWIWADAHVDVDAVHKYWIERRRKADDDLAAPPTVSACEPESVAQIPRSASMKLPEGIFARDIEDSLSAGEEAVLPDFCAEEDLPVVRKRIEELLRAGVKRVRVTSLYGFRLLPPGNDIIVTTSFPLPVCNRSALKQVLAMGASRAQAWLELGSESLSALAEGLNGAVEVYTYGRPALLSTRFHIPAHGRVTDGRGGGFLIFREGSLANLYSASVLSIAPPIGVSRYSDLRHAEPGEETTSTFNYSRELV